jgi:hypothetical protein
LSKRNNEGWKREKGRKRRPLTALAAKKARKFLCRRNLSGPKAGRQKGTSMKGMKFAKAAIIAAVAAMTMSAADAAAPAQEGDASFIAHVERVENMARAANARALAARVAKFNAAFEAQGKDRAGAAFALLAMASGQLRRGG